MNIKIFVQNFEKEIASRLKKLESPDLHMLKKSLEASFVLDNAPFRWFVASYIYIRNRSRGDRFFKDDRSGKTLHYGRVLKFSTDP